MKSLHIEDDNEDSENKNKLLADQTVIGDNMICILLDMTKSKPYTPFVEEPRLLSFLMSLPEESIVRVETCEKE